MTCRPNLLLCCTTVHGIGLYRPTEHICEFPLSFCVELGIRTERLADISEFNESCDLQ